ncbi:hypothetical protein AAMO2058_000091000 [Amorphochlora amoebiformis]|uniref:AP2/ERF domain-containing protein n=1 Tax=Amorphochlora amoebiformis TaxID=1561963 RepID=A0A7S0H6D9_9EUKA|mmetsp:Transcript_6370/g.9786  ORF Transcript_6370/g.9786 Transcript_6370/m.9786 type:complete len:400 (+) Transcript_6370:70-1269(+)
MDEKKYLMLKREADAEAHNPRKSKRIRRDSAILRQIKEQGNVELSDETDEDHPARPDLSDVAAPVGPHVKVKGVSYNHKSKLWGASWYENGKRIDKAFSVSRYGPAQARQKAIQWRREREQGIPYQKPTVKGTCSQVRGVHFDQRNKQWKASWSINGRRFEKTFSVSKYGDAEAKRMAIQWRRDREAGLPYEKPKRTCEVRGVWYMRWSKTWVASWSENGKWVRKSFSVSKYGEKGARDRAIECRNSHTKSTRKAKVIQAPGTPETYPPPPTGCSIPKMALQLAGGGDEYALPHEAYARSAMSRPTVSRPPVPKSALTRPSVPRSTMTRTTGQSLPRLNPKANLTLNTANNFSRPLPTKTFPITPNSKKSIYEGAEVLVDILQAQRKTHDVKNRTALLA